MHKSATRRLGSAPGQVPANKGKRYRAEVLSRAEADALIAACSAASRTGIRNRALITLLYRGGVFSRGANLDTRGVLMVSAGQRLINFV